MKRRDKKSGKVLETRFEFWIPPVLLVPLIPIAILGVSFSTDELNGLEYFLGFGAIWTLYCAAWIVSRIRGERRVLFDSDQVYLPPGALGLRGRFVPYKALQKLIRHGPGNSSLIIEFKGGSRNYSRNFTDTKKLEKLLRARVNLPETLMR